MRQKINIPAMHEKDMREYLSQLGLAEKIDRGELECVICGTILTWDNIGAFIMKAGNPTMICSRTECIENAQHLKTNG